MMIQTIIVYSLFALALTYLGVRFFGKKKAKKSCGGDSCGC
ncbi:FeoB-associated Cys-rich membrane protein [Putridiphycobacter roseus]|uniref:FeoB-associated Cys-rich membrane protein n=1 Tax=Putridiphycobacter roseus TaxID=2219161 RepID=A0A2W1MWL4_9FLAO|nr:FeoB-associated Cys-rich membrane protein [Putridiphycobacter roseus]